MLEPETTSHCTTIEDQNLRKARGNLMTISYKIATDNKDAESKISDNDIDNLLSYHRIVTEKNKSGLFQRRPRQPKSPNKYASQESTETKIQTSTKLEQDNVYEAKLCLFSRRTPNRETSTDIIGTIDDLNIETLEEAKIRILNELSTIKDKPIEKVKLSNLSEDWEEALSDSETFKAYLCDDLSSKTLNKEKNTYDNKIQTSQENINTNFDNIDFNLHIPLIDPSELSVFEECSQRAEKILTNNITNERVTTINDVGESSKLFYKTNSQDSSKAEETVETNDAGKTSSSLESENTFESRENTIADKDVENSLYLELVSIGEKYKNSSENNDNQKFLISSLDDFKSISMSAGLFNDDSVSRITSNNSFCRSDPIWSTEVSHPQVDAEYPTIHSDFYSRSNYAIRNLVHEERRRCLIELPTTSDTSQPAGMPIPTVISREHINNYGMVSQDDYYDEGDVLRYDYEFPSNRKRENIPPCLIYVELNAIPQRIECSQKVIGNDYKKSGSTFVLRKQRAASVTDPSVLTKADRIKNAKRTIINRASSVDRNIFGKEERSLTDIITDLKLFHSKYNLEKGAEKNTGKNMNQRDLDDSYASDSNKDTIDKNNPERKATDKRRKGDEKSFLVPGLNSLKIYEDHIASPIIGGKERKSNTSTHQKHVPVKENNFNKKDITETCSEKLVSSKNVVKLNKTVGKIPSKKYKTNNNVTKTAPVQKLMRNEQAPIIGKTKHRNQLVKISSKNTNGVHHNNAIKKYKRIVVQFDSDESDTDTSRKTTCENVSVPVENKQEALNVEESTRKNIAATEVHTEQNSNDEIVIRKRKHEKTDLQYPDQSLTNKSKLNTNRDTNKNILQRDRKINEEKHQGETSSSRILMDDSLKAVDNVDKSVTLRQQQPKLKVHIELSKLKGLINRPGSQSELKQEDFNDDASNIDHHKIEKPKNKLIWATELLGELRQKLKRNRSASPGSPESNKKMTKLKPTETPLDTPSDLACYTDKSYCFRQNVTAYSCRLCEFSGEDIVAHFRHKHPHSQIPISRMAPEEAKKAISQYKKIEEMEINYIKVMRGICSDKYECRFCLKKENSLSSFFRHVVNNHTGEYKMCSSGDVSKSNVNIPQTPKEEQGQLMGWICNLCNYTQISLKNLKTHFEDHHKYDETIAYPINVSSYQVSENVKTLINQLIPRTSMKNEVEIKEKESHNAEISVTEALTKTCNPVKVFEQPHFKISHLNEFVCCINGKECHFKHRLHIHMIKHIKTKHDELWDGYCYICETIVTVTGRQHNFNKCLQHYLYEHRDEHDEHRDEIPIVGIEEKVETSVEAPAPKQYINVRPISELTSNEVQKPEAEALPIQPSIENVASLSTDTEQTAVIPKVYAKEDIRLPYSRHKAASKKQTVVLASMMRREKLVNVFKCAGSFCSYSSDSVELSLLHASTHERVGGEGSLSCAYCNFDCKGNVIDLVMHVFKSHGCCPFVCGHCFYRAAAVQLVASHITTMHPGQPMKVLKSSSTYPLAPNVEEKLQEEVVRPYICPHGCQHRTLTAFDFCEHIQQSHANEHFQSCWICSSSVGSAAELVEHLKTHQLNVYQCTWCEHGANHEAQLLAHAAAVHPDAPPRAYLRTMPKEDGSDQLRMLPLNLYKEVEVEEVPRQPPSIDDQTAEAQKEAERSIELEKLIGKQLDIISPLPTTSSEAETNKIQENQLEILRLETPPLSPPVAEDRNLHSMTNTLKRHQQPSDNHFGIIDLTFENNDSEPGNIEQSPTVNEVANVTMEPQQPVKTMPIGYQKIPSAKLMKCPKCFVTCKNSTLFKIHTARCLQNMTMKTLICPHCGLQTGNQDELIKHYTEQHSHGTYSCGICDTSFKYRIKSRKHMKDVHGISRAVASDCGNGMFVMESKLAAYKRKRLAGAVKRRKAANSCVPAKEPVNSPKCVNPANTMSQFPNTTMNTGQQLAPTNLQSGHQSGLIPASTDFLFNVGQQPKSLNPHPNWHQPKEPTNAHTSLPNEQLPTNSHFSELYWQLQAPNNPLPSRPSQQPPSPTNPLPSVQLRKQPLSSNQHLGHLPGQQVSTKPWSSEILPAPINFYSNLQPGKQQASNQVQSRFPEQHQDLIKPQPCCPLWHLPSAKYTSVQHKQQQANTTNQQTARQLGTLPPPINSLSSMQSGHLTSPINHHSSLLKELASINQNPGQQCSVLSKSGQETQVRAKSNSRRSSGQLTSPINFSTSLQHEPQRTSTISHSGGQYEQFPAPIQPYLNEQHGQHQAFTNPQSVQQPMKLTPSNSNPSFQFERQHAFSNFYPDRQPAQLPSPAILYLGKEFERERTPNLINAVISIDTEALPQGYPRLVPERLRYQCGSDGCIMLFPDKESFKDHWRATHSTAIWFHCAHCQDRRKIIPVEGDSNVALERILRHFSMHDVGLFVCSACKLYHFSKTYMEDHASAVHRDLVTSVQICTVREELQLQGCGYIMDQEPWQCGLCEFSCIQREIIIEHYYSVHKSLIHRKRGIFYYFYKGDSRGIIDIRGEPRWMYQKKLIDSGLATQI